MTATGRDFLAALRREIETHPGVGHSLLGRMTLDPRSREDFRILGEQHYPLVTVFTRYLELLLLSAPDSRAKNWLAKVLVDEYGEGSGGLDHATLYLDFLRAAGVPAGGERRVPLHPEVTGFIREHLRIVTEEPFLVGLGAVGPGHEWAIPAMFDLVIRGLRRAGFREDEIGYFTLHVKQDQDHGSWLEEALALYCTTGEDCAQVRRGALLSLSARERFWWGVADKLNAGRARQRSGRPSSTDGSETAELTLEAFSAMLRPRIRFSP